MSKDIVVQSSEYVALVPVEDGISLGQIVEINQGGHIDPSILDRVRVPAGGGTAWEVPTISGETESVKELKGIIVGAKDSRLYFSKKYDGSNDPPDCFSDDGITGVGDPGGNCAECPLSKFGSGGERPRCAQRKLILLLRSDSVLPIVLNLPPSSLREVERYFMRLSAQRKTFFQVETTFKLEKDKSGDGIVYSRAIPVFSRFLTPEESASAGAMWKSLSRALGGIAIAEEEVPF